MRALLAIGLAFSLGASVNAEPPGALARLGKPQARKSTEGAAIAFSADGKRIAWVTTAEGEDENKITVHVWDVAGRKEVCRGTFAADTAKATTPLAFTPDGKRVLLGTYHEGGGPAKVTRFSGSRVRLWDAGTGKEQELFEGHRGGDSTEFHCLAVAPNGKTLITTSNAAVQVWDMAGGKQLRQFTFSNEDEGGVLYEVLSPDGKVFASCLNANPVRLWDVATGKQLRELKGAGGPLAFSPDGKVLATSGDGQVRVWATGTGKELVSVKGITQTATFSQDARVLAWMARDRTAHLLEVSTGKALGTLKTEGGPLAFSPDGKTLASVCSDGTVLLWKATGPGK